MVLKKNVASYLYVCQAGSEVFFFRATRTVLTLVSNLPERLQNLESRQHFLARHASEVVNPITTLQETNIKKKKIKNSSL